MEQNGGKVEEQRRSRLLVFESLQPSKTRPRSRCDHRRSPVLTRIWYRKYWMNCFSRGREVRRRWRSVPRSSVTK